MLIRPRFSHLGAVLLALTLVACGDDTSSQQAASPQKNAVSVDTMTLQSQKIDIIEEMPGRTIAYRETDVRPQVDGIIQKRLFEEGAFVEKGQSLYLIDPKVYQASLDAAKADLAKENASLSLAAKTQERYRRLIKTQASSQQAYDDAVASHAQARAAVAAAKAELDQAEIKLEYTTVRAKISGQIGSSDVNEGSLVTASQTNPLTTITQLDPIYVDVTQAGGRLMKIKQAVDMGRIQGTKEGKIDVSLIIDATGETYPLKGTLQFSDVTVNETTGTVRLRAVFPNPDHNLLPGMFVRANVTQGTLESAFRIPQKAAMRRPDGSAYVYLVKDGKAAAQPIGIEKAQGEDWIVTSGISDGDILIVNGIQRVGPGSDVAPQPLDAPKQQ